MASTTIQVTVPPYLIGPSLSPISQDTRFCTTCLNLSSATARAQYPFSGLFHRADTRHWDYNGWAQAVPLLEIYNKASGGCSSCKILEQALKELTAGRFDHLNIRVYIIFRQGDALNLRLCLVKDRSGTSDEEDNNSFWFAGVFDGPSLPEIQAELASYELYTVPGTFCPWPTIGSQMNRYPPQLDYDSGAGEYRWYGGVAKHIDQNPGSQSSVRKTKAMMESCSEKHAFCKAAEELVSKEIRRLPKRVIDVGNEDNMGIHVYEHDYERKSIKEKYIALSHSWGEGTEHTKLMRGNHNQRQDNIPFNELPPLYKDAVAITRRFGFRYIWIDSLCIFQDSEDDFATEGAKMGLIYEGAEFVLAAASSPNGDSELCAPRAGSVEVKGKTTTGQSFSIFAREECCHKVVGDENAVWRPHYEVKDCSRNWDMDHSDSEYFEPMSTDYPLHYRAWCLQERLLGLKVLHFAKQEILYECLTSLDCECGFFEDHHDDWLLESRRDIRSGRQSFGGVQLETIPFSERVARTRPSQRKGFGVPEAAKIDIQHQESSRHRELWRDLVVQYTQKKLTNPEDGLDAIGGLAERWENPATTGEYLAGLWEHDILNGLRWMPDTEEPETTLSSKFEDRERRENRAFDRYLAPSWSWASIQRGVSWKDPFYVLDLDNYFVSVNMLHPPACKPKYPTFKHGQVSNGYILLTGEIMVLDFFIETERSLVFLVKNGVTSPATAVDSLSRLSAEPILKNKTSDHKTPMRQLYCLRFCTKPIPAFGNGGGIGSEGALLLLDARPSIKSRQPNFVRDHQFVFERIGLTYGYMKQEWDHDLDSEKVDFFLV